LPRKNKNWKKNYRDWLERDVAYIITKDERDAFLKLTADEAREQFIETSGKSAILLLARPPTPTKMRFTSRIAFADARFGIGSRGRLAHRSWRTYITLGPLNKSKSCVTPQSLSHRNLVLRRRQFALPPFFYVMFYQRDGGGDYRFYSPYTDGPDKLVTGWKLSIHA